VLKTLKNRVFRAARVIWALPPGQFPPIAGTLPQKMRNRKAFYGVERGEPAAILNLYFDRSFWTDLDFDFGFCRQHPDLPFKSNWGSFSIIIGPLVQFIATPRRQETHTLRIFFEGKHAAAPKQLFDSKGLDFLAEKYVDQLRRLSVFSNSTITLVGANFHYEQFAYARLDPAYGTDPKKVESFAARPDAEEEFCFASEGFALANRGWMAGAVKSSQNCLLSVFKDYFSEMERIQWSQCIDYNNQILNAHSWSNPCIRLAQERDLRDIAFDGAFSKQFC
jgi:hypothetical protein